MHNLILRTECIEVVFLSIASNVVGVLRSVGGSNDFTVRHITRSTYRCRERFADREKHSAISNFCIVDLMNTVVLRVFHCEVP